MLRVSFRSLPSASFPRLRGGKPALAGVAAAVIVLAGCGGAGRKGSGSRPPRGGGGDPPLLGVGGGGGGGPLPHPVQLVPAGVAACRWGGGARRARRFRAPSKATAS